jgi:curved DNA-binding protein CbpA
MNLLRALEIFEWNTLDGHTKTDVKTKYKVLAKAHHPDRGGNTDEFVNLRRAYVLLLEEAPVMEESREIVHLSKDELLKRYQSESNKWQSELNKYVETFHDQTQTIEQAQVKVAEIVVDFETKSKALKDELDGIVSDLEKSHKKSFLSKIFFFWVPASEEDFWSKYYQYVEEYSKKHMDLNVQYFQDMLSVYGDGLNHISKVIDEAEVLLKAEQAPQHKAKHQA